MKAVKPTITLLFSVLIIFANATSFGQNNRNIDTVVSIIMHYYPLSMHHYYTVAHKPQGWYLQTFDYNNLDSPIKTEPIWLNNEQDWRTYAERIVPTEQRNQHFDYILSDKSRYATNKYYGYVGWDWDAISTLEPKLNKNEKEKEQLARAYAQYPTGYFSDVYGLVSHKQSKNRQPLPPAELRSAERVDSFLFYAQKTVGLYEEILLSNRDYETPVGNIKYKYINEMVDIALKLAIYSDQKTPKNLKSNIQVSRHIYTEI